MKRLVVSLFVALSGCAPSVETAQSPPDPPMTEKPMPEPVPQEITETEVEFEAAGMTIYGNLVRPAGPGPFPATVIIAGSGPTDRNWGGPLLPGNNGSGELLAARLADEGIASIRYDKRGSGKTGMPAKVIEWDHYLAEARAALKRLSQETWVDGERVFVAGHSEGGAHALQLMNSTDPPDVAGIILLATSGRRMMDLVVWQIRNQLRNAGLDDASVEQHGAKLLAALEAISRGETVAPEPVSPYPGVRQLILAFQAKEAAPFARDVLKFDPVAAFAGFDQRVLMLSGDKDIQVDKTLDLQPLAEASRAAGHDTTMSLIENADHVLKHEERPRGALTAEVGLTYNAPGRILATSIAPTMSAWMRK